MDSIRTWEQRNDVVPTGHEPNIYGLKPGVEGKDSTAFNLHLCHVTTAPRFCKGKSTFIPRCIRQYYVCYTFSASSHSVHLTSNNLV